MRVSVAPGNQSQAPPGGASHFQFRFPRAELNERVVWQQHYFTAHVSLSKESKLREAENEFMGLQASIPINLTYLMTRPAVKS